MTSADTEEVVESKYLVTYKDSENNMLIRQWVMMARDKNEAVVRVFEQDPQMGLLISVEEA